MPDRTALDKAISAHGRAGQLLHDLRHSDVNVGMVYDRVSTLEYLLADVVGLLTVQQRTVDTSAAPYRARLACSGACCKGGGQRG